MVFCVNLTERREPNQQGIEGNSSDTFIISRKVIILNHIISHISLKFITQCFGKL